jgi:hypothetical protein
MGSRLGCAHTSESRSASGGCAVVAVQCRYTTAIRRWPRCHNVCMVTLRTPRTPSHEPGPTHSHMATTVAGPRVGWLVVFAGTPVWREESWCKLRARPQERTQRGDTVEGRGWGRRNEVTLHGYIYAWSRQPVATPHIPSDARASPERARPQNFHQQNFHLCGC